MTELTIPLPGAMPAYLAVPTGQGPWPGVVVISDVMGMTADWSLHGTAAKLEGALTVAGVPHNVKEYPDAGQSFLNDHDPKEFNPLVVMLARVSNSRYHEPSAVDARRRILAFFDEHLRDPTTGGATD